MAATPTIAVQITGKSDLQKIFGQTNKQMAAFQAHSQKTAAQITKITSIGKAGFAAVDKTVTSLVRNTFDLFRNVSRIVDPLGIITGGATLAGLTALEAKFAQLGLSQVNTARGLNMSITSLSRWQGAAKIAGFSADTATDGIRATEQAMAGAKLGQNNGAAAYLNQLLGPGWKKMNDTQLLMAEAKKLQGLHGGALALAESNIGGALGQSQDFISFLAQGPAALQKQLGQAQNNGAMTGGQAGALAALGQGINSLEGAIEGVATSVTATLAPDITKALSGITDWLDKNRPAITADFKSMFGDAETFLKEIDWKADFARLKLTMSDIGVVVKAMGGWKPVVEGVLGVLTSPAVLGIALPFVALGAAITGLSGGGAGSFAALGGALRRIGFGVVGGQIVRVGVANATGSSDAGRIAGDATTGAIWGGDIAGRYGAILGGAAGLVYGLATDPAAHPASGKLPKDIADEIKADARKYGVPEGFALAQFRAEGGGYNNVSKAGAFGPAQLMPGTAKMLGVATGVGDPAYDWRKNVDAGLRYDKQLMDQFNKQNSLVALAYNWGPGNAESWLHGGHSMDKVPDETKAYIAQIRANGGLSMTGLQPDGNIGFGFTPSGNHKGMYEAMDGTWKPLDQVATPIGMDSEDRHVVVDLNIKHDKIVARTSKTSPGVTANIKTVTAMPYAGRN
jgi:hypothetical protein